MNRTFFLAQGSLRIIPVQQRIRLVTSRATADISATTFPTDSAFPASSPSFPLGPTVQLQCHVCCSEPISPPKLTCPRCQISFASTSTSTSTSTTKNIPFVDLTLDARLSQYEASYWNGTELFRSPVISFIYEKGWRQSFAWGGFPGLEEEAQMALKVLEPAYGNPIVDVSCGSGLFTRAFLDSGRFSQVVASDFSENMLKQTDELLREKNAKNMDQVLLVRADVGRLPFATGSISGIHAGA